MSKMAWVTPEAAPEDFECRELFVPSGQSWWAILTGALYALTEADNFEQVTGLTPEATASIFSLMFRLWDKGECPMFAGMIAPAACANAPSSRWLLCDGASYLRADYPALFSAIGTTFGSADGTHFNVPDLAGRAPIGVGSGSGLTPRTLAASGGEETHQLIIDEMPDHNHIVLVVSGGSGPYGGFILSHLTNLSTGTYSGAAGGDGAHNNMQPYIALNFFIYTG